MNIIKPVSSVYHPTGGDKEQVSPESIAEDIQKSLAEVSRKYGMPPQNRAKYFISWKADGEMFAMADSKLSEQDIQNIRQRLFDIFVRTGPSAIQITCMSKLE